MSGLDLTGQRFGTLVVLSFFGSKNGRPRWLVKCDCEREFDVMQQSLRGGKTLGCGFSHETGPVTAEEVRRKFSYDPETGLLTRLHGPFQGVEDRLLDGYVVVTLRSRHYRAHRLIWLYVHGIWPSLDIDHRNGVRSDNRILNLREASVTLNNQNVRQARSHNKSTGLLGAYPTVTPGRWRARIVVNRKPIELGCFSSPEEAHATYLAAKRELHEGCTI